MLYTGRVTISIISIIVGIPYTLYNYTILHSPIRLLIDSSVLLITTILVWWLGKQYDRAKFYSEKDYLTGIYNRRFIDELFPKKISEVNRNAGHLSLLLLDCNNFKQINDQYGHKMGDLVLQKISDLIIHCLKEDDVAARWGGDEFLIIAPFTNREEAENLKKRIEKGLEELSQKMGKDISVSIGKAIYPSDAKDIDSLIKVADLKMYELKQSI